MNGEQEVVQSLQELKAMVAELLERAAGKQWYSTVELAQVLGKKSFTVREWARRHRIRAQKSLSGRGPFAAWVVSAEEVRRIQKEGLLPRGVDKAIR